MAWDTQLQTLRDSLREQIDLYYSINNLPHSEVAKLAAVMQALASGGGGGDASAANQLTEIARLEAVRDRLPTALIGGKLSVSLVNRGALTNLGGTTSGTANTWTQIAAENLTRSYFHLQNTSDTTIQLGVGAAAAEFAVAELSAGQLLSAGLSDWVTTQRLAVRCVTAVSKPYLAVEA